MFVSWCNTRMLFYKISQWVRSWIIIQRPLKTIPTKSFSSNFVNLLTPTNTSYIYNATETTWALQDSNLAVRRKAWPWRRSRRRCVSSCQSSLQQLISTLNTEHSAHHLTADWGPAAGTQLTQRHHYVASHHIPHYLTRLRRLYHKLINIHRSQNPQTD